MCIALFIIQMQSHWADQSAPGPAEKARRRTLVVSLAESWKVCGAPLLAEVCFCLIILKKYDLDVEQSVPHARPRYAEREEGEGGRAGKAPKVAFHSRKTSGVVVVFSMVGVFLAAERWARGWETSLRTHARRTSCVPLQSPIFSRHVFLFCNVSSLFVLVWVRSAGCCRRSSHLLAFSTINREAAEGVIACGPESGWSVRFGFLLACFVCLFWRAHFCFCVRMIVSLCG